MNFKRALFTATLFVVALTFPYWIYIPLLFMGLVYFSFYIEAIILGFVIDALAGSLLFGPITTLLVLGLQPLREYLRINV